MFRSDSHGNAEVLSNASHSWFSLTRWVPAQKWNYTLGQWIDHMDITRAVIGFLYFPVCEGVVLEL